jgi:hypothetical protein
MPSQSKKDPTAAERQGNTARAARAEELALRDEVLRLRQQLERLASKSGPESLMLVLGELHIPPGGVRKLWQCAPKTARRSSFANDVRFQLGRLVDAEDKS